MTAGSPIEAIENPDDFFPLPTHLVPPHQKVFMLNVSGDSMINAGIYDGDQIIVKQQSDAHNGDIIVAMLDEGHEVTVKRFFREAEYVRLQPENDLLFFQPMLRFSVKSLAYLEQCKKTVHTT